MASAPQPLESREIQVAPKNGVHKSVPALHKTWVSERGWVSFREPFQNVFGLPNTHLDLENQHLAQKSRQYVCEMYSEAFIQNPPKFEEPTIKAIDVSISHLVVKISY